MSIIDVLRDKLHESIERGNKEEIQAISQELDIEIVKHMEKRLLCKKIKCS